MSISGDFAEVFNSGSVLSGSTGLEITGDFGQLVNSGTVTSGTNGLIMSGDDGEISNTGTVVADFDGVRLNLSPGDTARLFNSGSITSLDPAASAVQGSLGDETVTNIGLLVGSVDLLAGNDVYHGAQGTVTGAINGGDGLDILIGGAGDNTINGGNQGDTIRGNAGDDTLNGEIGFDSIYGGRGDDTITGGLGNDRMWGRLDNDTISGDGGNDQLWGNVGNDTLRGGTGNDRLHGGVGDDGLTGGGGVDTFIFGRDSDNDVITDFTNGVDRINVSAFGLSGFGELSSAISQNGGDAFIDWSVLGGDGLLTINGAQGQLNGADFIF